METLQHLDEYKLDLSVHDLIIVQNEVYDFAMSVLNNYNLFHDDETELWQSFLTLNENIIMYAPRVNSYAYDVIDFLIQNDKEWSWNALMELLDLVGLKYSVDLKNGTKIIHAAVS